LEDLVRFNDKLTEAQLDSIVYSELNFRGNFMLKERLRIERERLIAASFSAWQMLQGTVEKLPQWNKYVKQLGLSDEPEGTKEDLKREAEHAMNNAQRIIDKARVSDGGR
jgi:hypothetical protein